MPPARDPEQTRHHLLQVTAEEMRIHGYKAASLADILENAGVSKGALYHHFANKLELGYAVFDEIFVCEFLEGWEIPLSSGHPIDALCEWFAEFASGVTLDELQLGCPVYTIAVEMSATDEGFRSRTMAMFDTLRSRIAKALATAQAKGQVNTDVDTTSVAAFIVTTVQGALMQGKFGRDLVTFKSSIHCLANYIGSLKHP